MTQSSSDPDSEICSNNEKKDRDAIPKLGRAR